jgi:tetratricopeptide (TPR) repeat protein
VRAADLLPGDVDVQLTAGNLLLLARKPEEALARADAALKVQPANIDALLLRGSALAGLTSYMEAIESIEQAIQLDPERGTTYINLGQVQLAQGRRDDAEATLKRATSLSPREPQTHLTLGNFYWSTGRSKEAEQAFKTALEVDPANLQANRFMASFLFYTGRKADAEQYYRRIADSSESPQGKLALADYYLVTGRANEAISTLEPMEKIPAVQLRLARAQARSGDVAKAHSIVGDVLKANSKNADAQLLKGELLLQEGKREEAFAAIQTASSLAPSSADTQFALGRMYVARGDRNAAEAAFREVLRINPRASAAQVQLASLQARTKPEESVRTAQEATRSDPTSVAARLTLVRSLITAKDFVRAERELTRLRADHPNVAAVHVEDARLALLKNDVTAARTALERADGLSQGSDDTLPLWIALDMRQKNTSGVRSRLEERLKRGTNPELLLLAGRTYLAINDPAAAEKALRSAIEADPSRNEPYEVLGRYYVSQRKLDDAIREFDALSKKQAKPVGPLTMTGMLLQQQGNIDAAMKRYEDALAIDSRAGVAANNLAWLLAERNQELDRALQLAQTAVAAYPDAPQILDTLGWVYYKRNQPQQAITYFQQSVQKAPAIAEYHYHLGLALLKSGDVAKGRAALQLALDRKPSPAVSAEIRRALDSAN